ncbi:MAG: retroviral-like aspartic protease family protein [Candidatus Omnitrophica bacterium]|nr:retroviral-like aspartic protease family protein [Candidatus Omnitrophota bacterium]
MLTRSIILSLFYFIFVFCARADVLYLKNGRSIEGLVRREDTREIELNIGFGTVMFPMEEIASISRSSDEEAQNIRQQWQAQKNKAEEERAKKERAPKGIDLHKGKNYLGVDVLLNNRVGASLVIDTGASLVVLLHKTAEKLGLVFGEREKKLQMQLVDGRKIDARYIILDSIKIQDMEAREVEAAVLLEDIDDPSLNDGLLGMSFFKKFNFKIDQKNKKLILEKIE